MLVTCTLLGLKITGNERTAFIELILPMTLLFCVHLVSVFVANLASECTVEPIAYTSLCSFFQFCIDIQREWVHAYLVHHYITELGAPFRRVIRCSPILGRFIAILEAFFVQITYFTILAIAVFLSFGRLHSFSSHTCIPGCPILGYLFFSEVVA